MRMEYEDCERKYTLKGLQSNVELRQVESGDELG